eukprot:4201738-Prymnesium_polylepis.2
MRNEPADEVSRSVALSICADPPAPSWTRTSADVAQPPPLSRKPLTVIAVPPQTGPPVGRMR